MANGMQSVGPLTFVKKKKTTTFYFFTKVFMTEILLSQHPQSN